MSTMIFISFIAPPTMAPSEKHINANHRAKNVFTFFFSTSNAMQKKRGMLWNQIKSETTINIYSEIYTVKCNFKISLKRFFFIPNLESTSMNNDNLLNGQTNKQTINKNGPLIKDIIFREYTDVASNTEQLF